MCFGSPVKMQEPVALSAEGAAGMTLNHSCSRAVIVVRAEWTRIRA